MDRFDVPVAIFIFKRDKAVDIVRRIGEVKPEKLYIIADHGRNDEEKKLAENTRAAVEAAIDWDCEVIKNYAEENRGVYENIGEGAKWVLRREKHAIFLEDDNLPEITFFEFCRQMLEKYENDTRVLWICGTNYLGNYTPASGDSYVFTRHMLPCGWASWSNKFERFYDGKLELCKNPTVIKRVGAVYSEKALYNQYRRSWMGEFYRISSGNKPISWDYQMDLTIKANNLFGICPCQNQIKNIGVDEFSVHGGNSMAMKMTKRFCGMNSYPIQFPLKHPSTLLADDVFEKKIGKIMLFPLSIRIRWALARGVRALCGVPYGKSFKSHVLKGKKNDIK